MDFTHLEKYVRVMDETTVDAVGFIAQHVKMNPECRDLDTILILYSQLCNEMERRYPEFDRDFQYDTIADMQKGVMEQTYSDSTFGAVTVESLKQVCQDAREEQQDIEFSGLPYELKRIVKKVAENARMGKQCTRASYQGVSQDEMTEAVKWLERMGFTVTCMTDQTIVINLY